jgi:hypothetical protein
MNDINLVKEAKVSECEKQQRIRTRFRKLSERLLDFLPYPPKLHYTNADEIPVTEVPFSRSQ